MQELMDHFQEEGWVVLDLYDSTPVWQAREELQNQLGQIVGRFVALEEYHTIAQDDNWHTEVQIKLTQYFRSKGYPRRIVGANHRFFKELVGVDLLVQKSPYLRMTRPFKKQDNIGYHRDTFYGGSPFEVSVLVPFVNLEAESSLKVLSKSHVLSETLFSTTQTQNGDLQVTKGSEKHQLGFLYAPKLMDDSIEKDMKAIPLHIGQVLVFSLSTVHGSIENLGKITRWSSDMRVLNALAPVNLSPRPDYYETLSLTPVTATARQYEMANTAG